MAKLKRIDAVARRPGTILRLARQKCHMSTDDAACMLRIMPSALAEYEHGVREVPQHIMEHMFVMGYKMIQVRTIEHRYHNQRKLFRKINQTDTDAQ